MVESLAKSSFSISGTISVAKDESVDSHQDTLLFL